MDYKAFSKTLLGVYNSLEAVCERIDKMVEQKALSGVSDCGFGDPMKLYNKILDLSQRKINLINLKLRIENAIASLKEKEAKVLILKFIDRLTFAQISSLVGQTSRNCVRVLESAINNFSKRIRVDGLTEEKIFDTYAEEKWLFQIYELQPKEKCSQKIAASFKEPVLSKNDIVKIATKRVIVLE